jgi:hypothetical protein
MTTVLERPIVFESVLATVAAVDDLSPHLRRVTFVAPRIGEAVTAGPDQRIKVLLPPPDGGDLKLPAGHDWYTAWCAQPVEERFIMRTYTVRALRPEVAEMDIEFVLHGVNGPASAWVTEAKLGDQLGLIIPFAVDTSSTKGLLHSGVDYVPPRPSSSRCRTAATSARCRLRAQPRSPGSSPAKLRCSRHSKRPISRTRRTTPGSPVSRR